MAVPVLKLNLVPEPSLWRRNHLVIGWTAFGLGLAVFAGTVAWTVVSYHRASKAGQEAAQLGTETRKDAARQQQLTAQLQRIDVEQDLPRWRLADRILQERATPWSRLVAELEQCMVNGMRIKSVQRARGADQSVLLKLKGEAKDRPSETGFVEDLRTDPVFTQVVLEREAERQGGGWDFELSLPVVALLPPFVPKPIEAPKAKPGLGLSSDAPVKGRPMPSPAPLKPLVPTPAAARPMPVPTQPPTPVRPLPRPPMPTQDHPPSNRPPDYRELRMRRAMPPRPPQDPDRSPPQPDPQGSPRGNGGAA